MKIVKYHYHHYHHRCYFFYHDRNFIQNMVSSPFVTTVALQRNSDSSYSVWAKAAQVSIQPPLICKHIYFVQWAKYKDLYGNEKSPSRPKDLN